MPNGVEPDTSVFGEIDRLAARLRVLALSLGKGGDYTIQAAEEYERLRSEMQNALAAAALRF